MSVVTTPPPVKPFAAIFGGSTSAIDQGLAALNQILGEEPDLISPEFSITETAYYEKEMGPDLKKIYISWPTLISPEQLVNIKLAAMSWEQQNSPDGSRRANVDPGYIFSGGLVLSTAKFRGHRLPLGQGIWGELTLNYHHRQFQPFPWTYLDYQHPDIQAWLLKMRQHYMAKMKEKP